MAAIIMKIVLDGLDRIVPQLVGPFRETQRLREVLRRGHVLQAKRREKVKTEAHPITLIRAGSKTAIVPTEENISLRVNLNNE
jgi:hypothetical protein